MAEPIRFLWHRRMQRMLKGTLDEGAALGPKGVPDVRQIQRTLSFRQSVDWEKLTTGQRYVCWYESHHSITIKALLLRLVPRLFSNDLGFTHLGFELVSRGLQPALDHAFDVCRESPGDRDKVARAFDPIFHAMTLRSLGNYGPEFDQVLKSIVVETLFRGARVIAMDPDNNAAFNLRQRSESWVEALAGVLDEPRHRLLLFGGSSHFNASAGPEKQTANQLLTERTGVIGTTIAFVGSDVRPYAYPQFRFRLAQAAKLAGCEREYFAIDYRATRFASHLDWLVHLPQSEDPQDWRAIFPAPPLDSSH